MKLTARHRRLIMDEAAMAYPAECCGLLVGTGSSSGDDWTVTRVVPAANVAPPEPGHSIRDRFEVDPQTRFDLERELRGAEEAVIGHYHSHPDHPAEPSATDLAKAFEPSLIWIIAGIEAGETTQLNAFRLTGDAFEPLAVEIVDSG
jgi:proteasome lid subunit RPN8/RPN11